MIINFSCITTEKIYQDSDHSLSKKERKSFGGLDIVKAHNRLKVLNQMATEAEFHKVMHRVLKYHHLHGTEKYSIDANKRGSKWRITFEWKDKLEAKIINVKIEDTH